MIIQGCTISGQEVTILYGHLNISLQSSVQEGERIADGSKIAFLADDKSEYSASERKHLHLGIHKGNEIGYRGYVNNKNNLNRWINIEDFL